MEKIVLRSLFLMCSMAFFQCSGCQWKGVQMPNEKKVIARIAVESRQASLKILVFCMNNTCDDMVVRYELTAERTGRTGTARNRQVGSMEIAGWQEKCLSELDLSFSTDDQYQIELKVYKNEALVAKDSVSYPKEP